MSQGDQYKLRSFYCSTKVSEKQWLVVIEAPAVVPMLQQEGSSCSSNTEAVVIRQQIVAAAAVGVAAAVQAVQAA
jgi:hypothetical protein